jgi:endonuclease/exonuclease/phosphatase family metal-dependent hydrolase
MKGMKIALLSLLIILGIALIFSVFFFFWASSGSIPADRLSEIKVYSNSLFPRQLKSKSSFKVMAYNIGYLSGMLNNQLIKADIAFFQDNARKFEHMLKKIQPDFIGFQEIDYGSYRSYFLNQLDQIALHSGYRYAAKAINWDIKYVPFPYWPPSVHFRKVISGQAVLSRHPIGMARRIELQPIQHKPFYYRAFYLDRLVQMVRIEINGRQLLIMNIHLEAYEKETREKQAGEVLKIYRSVRDRYPVLLIGDFNCVPPRASQKSGFVDEPDMNFEGRNIISLFLQEESLKEAFLDSEFHLSESKTFTFPSDKPTRKLDYIFYDHRKINCIKAEVLKLDSSDHRPILMEFSFRPEY